MANSTPQHRNSNSKDLEAEDDYQEKRRLKAKNHELRQKQIAYRRDTVFSLSSRGLSQYKIAKILRVTQPLINQDIAYLRMQFREALKQHIEHELPLIYNQSMFGISEIIEHAYSIYHKDGVPEQIRLHALELISDCQQRRLDMATSGSIIEQGVNYVQNMRSNLNHLVRAIPEDQVREILHEEIAEGMEGEEQEEEQEQQQITTSGDDDSSRMDESSGIGGGAGDIDGAGAEIPNGINNSAASPTPPATTISSSTNSNTFEEEVEDQSNEDLSLTDSDNNNNSSTTTPPATNDDNDADAPTTNTIF
jgi:hypothetical protein